MKSVVPQDFQSSRIFAEGWNAARTRFVRSVAHDANPYPPGPEHTRWNEGYNQYGESDVAAKSGPT